MLLLVAVLLSQCSEKGKLSKGIDQNERSVHAASNRHCYCT